MRQKKLEADNKGFLLFEVMISIVIITAGLLFIMHSYSSSKNCIQRSTEVFETLLLLETKMWEFEEKGEIEEGLEDGGDFEEFEEYSWQIKTQRIDEDSDLNLVTLEVFQKENPEKTKYSVWTYLKNKQK